MAVTTIPTAGIANDAVDNTKLDLASNYAFTGTVTGAGSLKLVHTTSLTPTSAVSSISVTSVFTSSYNTYLIVLTDLTVNGDGTSNNNLTFKLLNSGGSPITSQIDYIGRLHTRGGSPSDYGGGSQTSVACAVNVYGDTASPICGYMWLYNPLKNDSRRNFIAHFNNLNNGAVSSRMYTQGILMGSGGTHTAVHGIEFLAGGNATQINGANSTYTSSLKIYGVS